MKPLWIPPPERGRVMWKTVRSAASPTFCKLHGTYQQANTRSRRNWNESRIAKIAIIEKQRRIVAVRRKFARKNTISKHLVVQRKSGGRREGLCELSLLRLLFRRLIA